jgi:hypothetical protein
MPQVYLGENQVDPAIFCRGKPRKIRELISHLESSDLACAVFAERFGAFTLEPTI